MAWMECYRMVRAVGSESGVKMKRPPVARWPPPINLARCRRVLPRRRDPQR